MLQASLYCSGREPCPTSAYEKRNFAWFGDRSADHQPGPESLTGVPPNGNNPDLFTLTKYPHRAVWNIEIAQVDADKLSEPESGRIKQLEHRSIP